MKFSAAFVGFVALASSAFAAPTKSRVPVHRNGELIPGSYIAVFHRDVEIADAKAFAASVGARHTMNIGKRFKALTGVFGENVLERLRERTDLFEFIEQDQVVRTLFETQNNATWGIDRVDQAALPLDGNYRYFETSGEGVDAYVIDTGILTTHTDFEGRAVQGYNFHDDSPDATDDNGHGTHCAGTIGGKTWGLAKNVNLIAVKVLGRLGSGSLANVALGVEWAAEQHNSAAGKKSVANMSLGGAASTSLDRAVEAAHEAGLIVVAASGNSDADACDFSPARVASIAVNAADNTDARASFSNFGACTDIFAPGVSITSTWIGSNTATNTISGTSMACPHVVGAVAVHLGQLTGSTTPDAVVSAILAAATPNVIRDVQGSPNRLLFSKFQ